MSAKPFSKRLDEREMAVIEAWLASRPRPCGALFDFFVGCATSCGRPAGHEGVHHPIPLALDAKP